MIILLYNSKLTQEELWLMEYSVTIYTLLQFAQGCYHNTGHNQTVCKASGEQNSAYNEVEVEKWGFYYLQNHK